MLGLNLLEHRPCGLSGHLHGDLWLPGSGLKSSVVLITLLIPILAACFWLVSLSRYLDFAFPIELYFVHVASEFIDPGFIMKFTPVFHLK